MFAAIFVIFILYILYKLLIGGWLYKGILGIFGWLAIFVILHANFIATRHSALMVGNYHISWSILIPTIILVLAMVTSND